MFDNIIEKLGINFDFEIKDDIIISTDILTGMGRIREAMVGRRILHIHSVENGMFTITIVFRLMLSNNKDASQCIIYPKKGYITSAFSRHYIPLFEECTHNKIMVNGRKYLDEIKNIYMYSGDFVHYVKCITSDICEVDGELDMLKNCEILELKSIGVDDPFIKPSTNDLESDILTLAI